MPISHPLRPAAAAALLALLGSAANAQAVSEPSQAGTAAAGSPTLTTVVVTASGSATELRDAPASISVITREDIERKPVGSLGELLSTIPGVTGGLSATGPQSKIKLRGLPDKYTLILIDGKRQGSSSGVNYRDDLGQQDLDWISPEMIERIEVVRGPMSSLYGSEAMGGVINIITRKVAKVWSGSVSTHYTQPDSRDRGDTAQVGFNISGPVTEDVGVRLGANITRRASDEGNDGFSPSGYQVTSGSRNQNVNALVNWKVNPDHTLTVEGSRGDQRASGSSAVDADGDPLVYAWGLSKLIHDYYAVSHEGRYGRATSKVNLYRNSYKDKGEGTIGNTSNETTLDGRFDVPFKLGIDQALTVGLQLKREELTNGDTIGTIPIDFAGNAVSGSKLKATNWALFGENQLYLLDPLSLTLGLRMDHHEKYGNNWSPRAYLVYHPAEAWTLKGGVSRGFRAPNLKENSPGAATQSGGRGCTSLAGLGWNYSQRNADGTTGCYMVGNPDLKPETSTSAELGVGFDRNDWSFGATYFHTNFKNKIDYAPLGYLNGYWWTRMANAQKARTRGVEATATVPVLRNLQWKTNVTRMLESKNLTTGADLLAVPKLTVYSTLDWQATHRWSVGLSAQHTGKKLSIGTTSSTYAKAYTTYDLTTRYVLNDQITLRAGVLNLTGKETREGNDFDIGGRAYFMGMTAQF